MRLKKKLARKKSCLVASHLFWNDASQLSKLIIPIIHDMFENHFFIIREHKKNIAIFNEGNNDVKKISTNQYRGFLKLSIFQRIKTRNKFFAIVSFFMPEFSFLSMIKLLKGTRNIVLHGQELNFCTILLLRLIGKHVILIHWGGKPSFGRFLGFFSRLAFRLHSYIFVLMDPEVDYFKSIMKNRVECLPYPSTQFKEIQIQDEQYARSIIIGNNCYCLESYCEILDQLSPKDWSSIICMLANGDEFDTTKTNAFIAKYRARFGASFYAWQTLLPYEEYIKMMNQTQFYCCASKTQSGLGAITNAIRHGKTLILRGDNLKWIRSLGVEVLDYDEIKDFSFKSLSQHLLTKENAKKSFENFKKQKIERYNKEYWKKIMAQTLK